MFGSNVTVADMLANDRSILAFHQRIVLRPIGSALGELDQQSLEQLGHLVVDILRAVVGVEAQNPKGKLMQDRLQDRQHKLLVDPFHAAYHLPLRHCVHGVDVIHPFGAFPVALVHRVDA